MYSITKVGQKQVLACCMEYGTNLIDMCGRFVLATKVGVFVDMLEEVQDSAGQEGIFTEQELDRLHRDAITLETEIEPQYNIAPRFMIPAIAKVKDESAYISRFKWGLLPPWAKDPKMGDRCFNARSETVAEKPMFRVAFKKSRGVILADGYYEWKKLDAKNKQPYYIHRADGRPMFFAGLVEPTTETATILTTEAQGQLGEIHNRHPVFIEPEDVGEWLDLDSDRISLEALMAPDKNTETIEAYPVSKEVGRVGDRNDANLIASI